MNIWLGNRLKNWVVAKIHLSRLTGRLIHSILIDNERQNDQSQNRGHSINDFLDRACLYSEH